MKSDDVSSLVVDGQYLTWKPKTPFVIKRQGASMIEEKIEVAYSAARPEDASVPYDTLLKNRVDLPRWTSGVSRSATSTRSSR